MPRFKAVGYRRSDAPSRCGLVSPFPLPIRNALNLPSPTLASHLQPPSVPPCGSPSVSPPASVSPSLRLGGYGGSGGWCLTVGPCHSANWRGAQCLASCQRGSSPSSHGCYHRYVPLVHSAFVATTTSMSSTIAITTRV